MENMLQHVHASCYFPPTSSNEEKNNSSLLEISVSIHKTDLYEES